MQHTKLVRINTADGLASVSPAAVVFIAIRSENLSEINLMSGVKIQCTEAAGEIARRLWRFSTESESGYYNDALVQAILPKGQVSQLIVTDKLMFTFPMPTEISVPAFEKVYDYRQELLAKEKGRYGNE